MIFEELENLGSSVRVLLDFKFVIRFVFGKIFMLCIFGNCVLFFFIVFIEFSLKVFSFYWFLIRFRFL